MIYGVRTVMRNDRRFCYAIADTCGLPYLIIQNCPVHYIPDWIHSGAFVYRRNF